MAYPTGMLNQTLESVDRAASTLKTYLTSRVAHLAAGNASASTVLDIYMRLYQAASAFTEAAGVSGIGDYAREQKNNANLDVITEFTAMTAAIATAKAWIASNIPASGGYLLLQTLGDSGPVDREFTPAQTGGLRTVLQAVIDTIG